MIDPIALRSLVALSREGAVHAAAASLGYTPSAVSQQLKKLERETGVALIERSGRGVLLTASGRRLVEEADELLRHMESVETLVRRGDGKAIGTWRVAAFSTAIRGLIPGVLQELATSAPDLLVKLREIDPWEAVDAVATGEQDCAIVHNWEPVPLSLPDHVVRVDLGLDLADVILPGGHALAAREHLSPADLRHEKWVTVRAGSICHQWLMWLLESAGGRPSIMHEVLEYDSQIVLVEPSKVLALIPRLGRAALPEGVVARPLATPATRRVMLVYRESMADHPATRALKQACSRSAADVLAPTVSAEYSV